MDFAEMIHAHMFELHSDCGHLAPGCEEVPQMTEAIQQFLAH